MKKRYFLLLIISLITSLAVALPLVSAWAVQAPASGWSEPLNLSRSGAATNPAIVADASGRLHAVWSDSFDGLMYSFRQGKEETTFPQWSAPAAVKLPFEEGLETLQLRADDQGWLHAVWRSKTGVLLYSRVLGERFGLATDWKATDILASNVSTQALTTSPGGGAVVVFITNQATPSQPAGVYSRSRAAGSEQWGTPRLLYDSPYYRGLKPGNATVSVAVGQGGRVYAAWDDRTQERIYLTLSGDNGESWAQPIEVDSRQKGDNTQTEGPARPRLAAQGKTILLLWQAGHQGTTCGLYGSWTQDGGKSWQTAASLPEPLNKTCPENLQLLPADPDTFYLMTSGNSIGAGANETWLLAWNANPAGGAAENPGGWSTPQSQPELTSFTNPDTFRTVQLGCLQAALTGASSQGIELAVAGCGGIASGGAASGTGAGEVWLLSRSLEAAATWFPTPTPQPAWGAPELLANTTLEFSTPALTADTHGRVHAFWAVKSESTIRYALWDGARWSTPLEVETSPNGRPSSPAAVVHPAGMLFLTWSDGGELYYALAPLAQALEARNWPAPERLTVSGRVGETVQVAVDAQGKLTIAYSVSFNEGRGIYLISTQSAVQAGQLPTWGTPEKVFDAEAAGWERVEAPRLALDAQGTEHMLWSRYGLPPANQPLGLYYSRSTATDWSTPRQVGSGKAGWSQLLTSAEGQIHIAWQELLAGNPTLFHQYSLDGGLTWSQPARLTSQANAGGPAALALDNTGYLHLLLINADGSSGAALQHWTWEGGENWSEVESEPLPDLTNAQTLSMAGAPLPGLAALYSGPLQVTEAAASLEAAEIPVRHGLFFSGRLLKAPLPLPTALPTFTPLPPGAASADATQTPSIQPTRSFSTIPANSNPLLSNRWAILAISAIPAVLLVAFIFWLVMRRQVK